MSFSNTIVPVSTETNMAYSCLHCPSEIDRLKGNNKHVKTFPLVY